MSDKHAGEHQEASHGGIDGGVIGIFVLFISVLIIGALLALSGR